VLVLAACLVLVASGRPSARGAGETAPGGSLLIIGGGLRPDNAEVYGRLIELAGGPERARIGIVPVASPNPDHARRAAEALARNGLPPERVVLIPLSAEDRPGRAADPDVTERIRACTGLFFTGGDQLKITHVFGAPGDGETPVLAAVREVYRRGGVVAGSSAGAAALPERMISSGAPLDALDFGLAAAPDRRGVLLSRGLGLFRAGLVDQHFNTYDGRIARLARALLETRTRLGFGVDEDTAMLVGPDGVVRVLGRAGVAVVDAAGADCRDGPLGCRMTGLRLSYLRRGDAFDPATGAFTVHPARQAIAPGQEHGDGNRPVTDLAQDNALNRAVTADLVDNTSRSQVGLLLDYNGRYAHGYRWTFTEADETRGYFGFVDGVASHAALRVRVDVEPVLSDLGPPEDSAPSDLASCTAQTAVRALVFRGVMTTDRRRRFRPGEPLSRAEFANALVRAAGLSPRRGADPGATDVGPDTEYAGDIARAVTAGIVPLEGRAFRPSEPVTRREVAEALARARAYCEGLARVVAPGPSRAGVGGGDGVPDRPARRSEPATREEVAVAVYEFLGLPW
jgi:cyanophycinase